MATVKFSNPLFLAAIAEIESLDLHHRIIDRLASALVKHFHHQMSSSLSDGEIYLKIVEAKTFGLEKNVQFWQARLSPPKLKSIERLLRRKKISDAFNELRVFPGLWRGLELGNISSLVALHCDEASRVYYPLLTRS